MDETIKRNSDEIVEKILENIQDFFEKEEEFEKEYENYTIFISFDDEEMFLEFDYELKDPEVFDADFGYVLDSVFDKLESEE